MHLINVTGMAHDEQLCRKAERAINSLFDVVKEAGGKVWIQSRENKEHYYEITENISVCFYKPVYKAEDMMYE